MGSHWIPSAVKIVTGTFKSTDVLLVHVASYLHQEIKKLRHRLPKHKWSMFICFCFVIFVFPPKRFRGCVRKEGEADKMSVTRAQSQ